MPLWTVSRSLLHQSVPSALSPCQGSARDPTVAWVSGSLLLLTVPVLEDMSALLLTRVFSMCMTVCSHGRRSGATGMRGRFWGAAISGPGFSTLGAGLGAHLVYVSNCGSPRWVPAVGPIWYLTWSHRAAEELVIVLFGPGEFCSRVVKLFCQKGLST